MVIPSRDERFLIPTIDDAMKNARGEFEIIAVLDSDKWPENWKEVCDRHPNLHTIHNGEPKGLRYSINAGVASAKSRGAKWVAKFDGHCSFSEGFDVILTEESADDWVVVPRRGRLDPENWVATETHKPDIDYHYLSFPTDPNDFGGPGLNGKPWSERAIERAEYFIDDEMSSQGSGWFMSIDHFYRLELMDQTSYGPFWNEMQEIGLKTWLSGGALKVNKRCRYLHLHKGTKYGRGYRLPESWLQQGATFTKNWIWNDAWAKQTKPFKWLIEHFWPVPSWPENWREVLYATRKPRVVAGTSVMGTAVPDGGGAIDSVSSTGLKTLSRPRPELDTWLPAEGLSDKAVSLGRDALSKAGLLKASDLVIHKAHYGIGSLEDIDVRDHLQLLVKDNSLDIIVNNSTLTPGQNPFRGRKKQLNITYSLDGGDVVTKTVEEKDWLIIGPVLRNGVNLLAAQSSEKYRLPQPASGSYVAGKGGVKFQVGPPLVPSLDLPIGNTQPIVDVSSLQPMTAPALNDYLIRRFQISPQRLRGPMPIELRDFHRNDLAQLFAELGFKRGAEIGVAEGNYSEILLKANPDCELLLVDPWHAYSDNPQNKSKEKHEYAYNEMLRKTKGYNVTIMQDYSMNAVRAIADGYLDFVYLDAMHSYPFIMEDLINWSRKVRSGGIVALDDIYKLNEKWGAGPMEAIYDYTRAMRINPWWLINAHKSVDAFFVKL